MIFDRVVVEAFAVFSSSVRGSFTLTKMSKKEKEEEEKEKESCVAATVGEAFPAGMHSTASIETPSFTEVQFIRLLRYRHFHSLHHSVDFYNTIFIYVYCYIYNCQLGILQNCDQITLLIDRNSSHPAL